MPFEQQIATTTAFAMLYAAGVREVPTANTQIIPSTAANIITPLIQRAYGPTARVQDIPRPMCTIDAFRDTIH